MSPDQKNWRLKLFRHMVSGSMATFAKELGSFVHLTMPDHLLGARENVYQGYLHGFFLGAGARWEIRVEEGAGAGRLDLMMLRGEHAIIQEYKRIRFENKNRTDGCGTLQTKQLTAHAEDAMAQIESRGYRLKVPSHVTMLREYGVAFLGPYCGIVGRVLERGCGEGWALKEEYTCTQDEERRVNNYVAQG
jgi:Protein of unknown function (DUF1703).